MSLKPGWLLRSAPLFCRLTKSVNHSALTSSLAVPGFPGAVFISDSALFAIPLEMKPLNVFNASVFFLVCRDWPLLRSHLRCR